MQKIIFSLHKSDTRNKYIWYIKYSSIQFIILFLNRNMVKYTIFRNNTNIYLNYLNVCLFISILNNWMVFVYKK